jgi:hypothetical protein
MDKIVRRVTVVRRNADGNEAVAVYREPKKRTRRVSEWSRPLERVARHLIRADAIFGNEATRLHDKSSRRRRDGWLFDLPGNVMKAQRKGYNEARKAVPFRLLPKA